MTNALTVTTMTELARFSAMIAKSGLAPAGLDTPEKIGVAVMYGMELGLSPMAALQSVGVIRGKPGLYGDGLLAVVQQHPDYEWHREYFEGEGESTTAICEVKRRGNDEPHVGRFSVNDAKRAGLWGQKGPWTSYPRRMLTMRARGFAVRDSFADALRGFKTVEELRDYPEDAGPAIDVGAPVRGQLPPGEGEAGVPARLEPTPNSGGEAAIPEGRTSFRKKVDYTPEQASEAEERIAEKLAPSGRLNEIANIVIAKVGGVDRIIARDVATQWLKENRWLDSLSSMDESEYDSLCESAARAHWRQRVQSACED